MDIKSVNNGSCIGRVRDRDVYVLDKSFYETLQEEHNDNYIIVRQPDDGATAPSYDLVFNGRIEGTVLNDGRINWGREPYMMYSRKYQKPKKPVVRKEEEKVAFCMDVDAALAASLDETDKMFKNILKEVDELVDI